MDDDEYPEKGLIKRTPLGDGENKDSIYEEYDDEDEDLKYKSRNYEVDDNDEEKDFQSPSMIDEAIEEENHSVEAERQALESEILQKLRRDRDPIGNVEYSSGGNVDPEEERRAIKVLLRQDDSIDGMKKISDKFKVDMKKVLAIKDEMEEEKRRMEHEQKILMQQRMMEIKNPEIPRHSSRSMNYDEDDYEEDRRPSRYEKRFEREVNPPAPSVGGQDMMTTLLTYMLQQGQKADDRAFQMTQLMMQNQQQASDRQMQMMMEMNKGRGGFFDGEFGDVLKAKMMANVLSPGGGGGPEVSGTALILKGLVDSGQLGGILTEATGLLRDMASKNGDQGYEPLDIDANDISTVPPQYRQPQQQVKSPKPQPRPRKEIPVDEYDEYDEYDYSYDELEDEPENYAPIKSPKQQKHRQRGQQIPEQGPLSRAPMDVEFEPYTSEWFAQKICEKFPDTEWDVARKSSELVLKRAQMAGTDMNNPNEQKEIAMSILAVIGGAQGVIDLARASKQLMEFDNKGNYKRSPEEAAEFVKENMPEKLNVLKAFDWDMMMETATHFEDCKSMAKAIYFLKHDKVSPVVKKFLMAIRTSPLKRPPNPVNNINSQDIGDDEFDENPFGGF
jgi:hypothetical protein